MKTTIAIIFATALLLATVVAAQQQQQPRRPQPPNAPGDESFPNHPHPPNPDPLAPLMFPPDMIMGHMRELNLTDESYLLVYPKVVPLERLGLPASSPFGDVPVRRQWLFEDPMRTVGVREYRPGDNPQGARPVRERNGAVRLPRKKRHPANPVNRRP